MPANLALAFAFPDVSFLSWVVVLGAAIWFSKGLVWIQENEVGIVIKRFSHRSLESHRKVALNGEAGVQADTLTPGMHLWLWGWKYTVRKVPQIHVQPGEIALVIANDGSPLAPEQLLGRAVECNNFQDARAFLTKGGQQGRQRQIMTAGKYRINTGLFTVITSVNAKEFGLDPDSLRVFTVPPDRIGIVTTAEGHSLPEGDIAAPKILSHDDYQNPQKFIDNHGYKGLQEAILKSGAWTLNPWFVAVELAELTTIPVGAVGVVVSYVGKPPESGIGGNPLVEPGFKGVCRNPLPPGRHPINTAVVHVEVVPTHDITLNWRTDPSKPINNYDYQLKALDLTSNDGFMLAVEVTQVICIDAADAPRMISRIGSTLAESRLPRPQLADLNLPAEAQKFDSIRNLISRVLKNLIDNHFRIAAQSSNAVDFLERRAERQQEAVAHIKAGLLEYGVQSGKTMLGDIQLPPALMKMRSERMLSQEELKTIGEKKATERERGELLHLEAMNETQKEIAASEQKVKIARMHAEAEQINAESQALTIRTIGEAHVAVMKNNLAVCGPEHYFEIERLKALTGLPMPEVLVMGSSGASEGSPLNAGLVQAMRRLTDPPRGLGASA